MTYIHPLGKRVRNGYNQIDFDVYRKGIGSDMVWLLNETVLTGDKNVEVYDKLGVSYEEVRFQGEIT